MVKIRLKRMGNKFRAFYRVVAADARAKRDGKFIEEVGYYDPHAKTLKFDKALWDKWIKEGAVPTETVKNLWTKFNSEKSTVIDEKENSKIVKLAVKEKKVKKEATPVIKDEAKE